MVSSACRGSCATMLPKSGTRVLNIDHSKDYSLPLQVETSVEYDLPAHIYPPKGSEPILMIHPAYTTPVRARKIAVTSQSSPVLLPSPSVNTKPLQVHNNQLVRSNKSVQTKWCSCGNISCNVLNSSSKAVSVKISNSPEEQSGFTNRQVSHVPENILYNSVKNNLMASDIKSQQKLHQKAVQKQLQLQQQQKQLQLQQQQQQQQYQQVQLQQYHERVKLQAQQLQQQLQSQQKTQQKSSSMSRQQAEEQLVSWGLTNRCHLPCCQPRVGALPPTPAEFLAPGLPPSLLTRTPTRGPTAGSSPKLRARTRRGISVAGTINLPEYLSTSRSSRTSSVGGIAGGSSHAHSRSRSSSMLASTPAAITAHQVATALDVVRSHVLTPRSLFASSQQIQSNINNTSSLLSTVGQSRDSGCSLSAEANSSYTSNESARNVDWSWSLVDSGFCTPVDNNDDQVMETYEATVATSGSYTPMNVSSTKESSATNIYWMKNLTTPLNSSSSTSSTSMSAMHTTFLPPPNHHYIPPPIWNLVY